MNHKTHTDRLIADAITRSISHTAIAPLTVSGYDISDLLGRIELVGGVDCGYAQENDGSYDVWSVDGKPFRLTVTIEASTDDIVDAVANSGVCCPEAVTDAVLYILPVTAATGKPNYNRLLTAMLQSVVLSACSSFFLIPDS